MSSAGHIMDMNNRMRTNRALLGRRRQRYAQLRELYRGAVEEKVYPQVTANSMSRSLLKCGRQSESVYEGSKY